jgi:hypothetical protein
VPDGFGLAPEGTLAAARPTPRLSFDSSVQRVVDLPYDAVVGLLGTATRTVVLPHRGRAELVVLPWSRSRSQLWLRRVDGHRRATSRRWFDAAHDTLDAIRREISTASTVTSGMAAGA